jgi:hypothetical protein
MTTVESALIELGHKDLLVKTMQDILSNVEKEMKASEMKHSPCDLEPGIGGEIARDKTNE